MNRMCSAGGLRSAAIGLLAAIGLIGLPCANAQQLSPEDKAAALLNAARTAQNERNYPVAAEKYRAFLKEFAGTPRTNSARYGLAVILMEAPEKDYKQAVELLSQVAGAEMPEKAFAAYYLGVGLREQGYQLLARAARKEGSPKDFEAQAAGLFERALAQFVAAVPLLSATPPSTRPSAGELSLEAEWAAKSRCDQAEMLMRLGRGNQVVPLLEPWRKDPAFAKSRYKNQANYLLGYAYFSLKDYLAAGKCLGVLAPFNDPAIGVHARYLLARTHHMADERPEAIANYEGVLGGYDAERKAAEQALRNPQALRPDEKSRLEALLNSPAPDYVMRGCFHLASLFNEMGKIGDAQVRYQQFIQQFPKSPLAGEAQLRLGITHVQLKQFGEAMQRLQPLADNPQLGDQALLWIARGQISAADPANPQAVQQSLVQAIETLRRASERARQLASTDPSVLSRRGEILLEMGDTQHAAKMYKEAAATYQRIMSEAAAPELVEFALARQAAAYQLAGQCRESDEVCQRFATTYPKSSLLGEVLFRHAENAYLMAVATPAGQDEAKRLYTEATKCYQQVIDKFPDGTSTSLARQGLGTALYQLGQFENAAKALNAVPESERTGDLAGVSYLLADCNLRTLPAEAEDALSIARLLEQLKKIADQLQAFVQSQETSPQAPDALIKLGYCWQRTAAAIADPQEKQKTLASARQAYAVFGQKYQQHPLMAVAVMEDARCLAQLGDLGGAAGQLQRFMHPPLREHPVAPLALIRLGEYMRPRCAAEAVQILSQVRRSTRQRC